MDPTGDDAEIPRSRPGRPKRISIRDVARAAEVSTTTVSYALNATGRLDQRTRDHVIAVAQRLGYRPNGNARNLRRQAGGVLTLATSLPEDLASALPGMEYFTAICQAATAAALERGYMLLMAPFGTPPTSLDAFTVDGALVIDPMLDDPLLAHLERGGIPTVTIGRDAARERGSAWWVDNDIGADVRLMLDHLHEAGASRVALLDAEEPVRSYSVDTREAYLAWAAEHDQSPIVAGVTGAPTELEAVEAAERLLGGPQRPDAIYTTLDRYAIGAMFAARGRGLDVPHDLMIAAGSDGSGAASAAVPITALDLHPEELGRQAVALLFERLDGAGEPRQLQARTTLRRRQSTDARPRDAAD